MECDTSGIPFEVGPIRPPSEAFSLLVRVSRNCPWNLCAFCSVYKHSEGYSRRPVADVLADLDAMQEVYGDSPRTVFLQDADPVQTNPDDLVAVVEGVRERFPRVHRITTYARARTLSRRSVADLRRLREAGLDRVHVGLESGSDEVLALMNKGVTRQQQIDGGRRAKEAGFELSEYVMPGLGGRVLSDAHADETASAVAAIEPDFVRLRTVAVKPGTPLAALVAEGRVEPMGELEIVAEIRRFFAGLEGVTTRIESDHALNLLMELRGDLPDAHEPLLALLDRVLAMEADDQRLFVLGRRVGLFTFLKQFERPGVREEVAHHAGSLLPDDADAEALFHDLRLRWV
jgi:radical SAM superfamily enzyme